MERQGIKQPRKTKTWGKPSGVEERGVSLYFALAAGLSMAQKAAALSEEGLWSTP